MGWYSVKRAMLSGQDNLIASALRQEIDPARSARIAMSEMTPQEMKIALKHMQAFNASSEERRKNEIASIEKAIGL